MCKSALLSRAPAGRIGRQRTVTCTAAASLPTRVKLAAAAAVVSTGLLVSPVLAAGVKFSNLSSNATVSSPVTVDMAVDGLQVKAAAEGLVPGTGHFHVLVDVPAPEEGEAIPFDDAHKHFGKGQTSAAVELAPGKHTLTLQFANALHESYGHKYASSVVVNVK